MKLKSILIEHGDTEITVQRYHDMVEVRVRRGARDIRDLEPVADVRRDLGVSENMARRAYDICAMPYAHGNVLVEAIRDVAQ